MFAASHLSFILMLAGGYQSPAGTGAPVYPIASPLPVSNNLEPEGRRRAEAQIGQAEEAFENARAAYDKGDVEKGDAALEQMTKALDACVATLYASHKAHYYKKAELRVANLQRRMKVLLEDIELPSRGWAEQTSRQLEEIHDKLLAGAMRK